MEARRFRPARPAAFLALLLCGGALLALPMPVAAAVDTTPTNIATSGFYSDIDVDGDTIAIAHRTSASNAIILALSADGGETWADRPTGVSATFNRLKVFIIDSDSFTIFYTNWGVVGGGTSSKWLTTHDGGYTWTQSAALGSFTPSSIQTAYCPTGGTAAVDDNTNTNWPDGAYANGQWLTTHQDRAGSNSNVCNYVLSSGDGFVTGGLWGGTQDIFADTSISIREEAPFYGEIWHRNPGELKRRTFSTNNAFPANNLGAALTIQDPIVPLTTYGFGVSPCPDFTCAFFHDASTTGRVMMAVQQPGNSGNTWFFYEVQSGTVNQIQLKAAQTTDGGSGVLMSYAGGHRWDYEESNDLGSTFTDEFEGTTPHASYIQNGVAGVCGSLWISYQDETTGKLALFVRNPEETESCISQASFISATNLVEADVDGSGAVIIARTDSGANVRSYNAASGAEIGLEATADCAGAAGVSSFNKAGTVFLSFGDCDASGDVDTLSVRSSVLGAPDFPSGCGNECQQDNEQFDEGVNGYTNTDFDVPADLYDLGTLSTAPYSFTFASGGTNYAYAVWTFSTRSGEVGIVGVLYNNGADNYGERALVTVNNGEFVDDFCSWRDSEAEKDYIAGVAYDGPTVVAEADFSIEDIVGTGVEEIHVSAGQVLSNTAPWGKAVAISCQANHALLKSYDGGTLYFINITGPQGEVGQTAQVWTKDTADSYSRTVSIASGTGQFAAYRDGSEIALAYASNGTEITTVPVPGQGTWVGLELDGTGSQLFVYESDGISIYDVSSSTCKQACGTTTDDAGANLPGAGTSTSTGSSGPGNVFRPAGATLPPGFSESTMDFFLGILFIVGLTIGLAGAMYAVTKNGAATKVGAFVGGGSGFLGSFALGLWPWWILTIVVVLAVAGIFIMRARSG